MKTRYGDEEFLPPAATTRPTTRPGIRNVILFVFESLPAEYVDVYGSKYNVTPELTKWKPHAVTFRNIYAHAPSTNMSMLSLLCSAYPALSYESITEQRPDAFFQIWGVRQLGKPHGVLKRAGYRMARRFWFRADTKYLLPAGAEALSTAHRSRPSRLYRPTAGPA